MYSKIVVTPVLKSGPEVKCYNCRPIAVPCCVSHIMERIINKTMISFFMSEDSLHPSQHGFLLENSVETAHVKIYDFLSGIDSTH